MKLRTTAFVILLSLVPASATGWQEPKLGPIAAISGPTAKLPGRSAIFHARGSSGKHLSWYIHPLPSSATFLPLNTNGQAGDALLFETEQVGKYEVLLVASDKPVELRPVGSVTLLRADGAVDVASMALEIRGDGPPVPPVPPKPDDPPKPPEPPPDAKVPFVGVIGTHVLILYESEDPLPRTQHNILFAMEMRNYLNTVCVQRSDGMKAWRIFDDDSDLSNEDPVWKNAAVLKTASPCILIGNGKTGYVGPLPNTTEETIRLIETYKG